MYSKYNDDNIKYKIGLYIRLSREDGDDLESESISNQRSLLSGYLKANGLVAVEEYVDDGYSGGNFNRPSFQRLIKDVENKKINCVITKDLSRLGRDYIDTGRYVERYFPENNVRYIAINDDIDTFYETSGSDMIPFKLSMNDMYAKDISKKVRSTLMDLKKNGKYCGSVAPYGYMKSNVDKHQLVPDPKTAPIVKKIFDLYVAGYGSGTIAEVLTREEVPTPILLKNSPEKINSADHPDIWKHTSVNNILKNRVYTGCVVQHTSQNINYKTKKRKKVPKSDWCIVENVHEPIIDLETFNIAQSIRDKSNTYNENHRNVDYNLSSLVYCKDCGARMTINYDKKRDRISMNCNNYRKFSKYGICCSHFMNYKKLEETIYSRISELSIKYLDNQDEFKKVIKDHYIDPRNEIENKIEQVKKDLDILKLKQDSLYDDKFNGVISVETYQRLFDNTDNEIHKLKEKLERYNKELKDIEQDSVSYDEYLNVIEQYLNMNNPTKEMINKIIDKIYITKEKDVEIHYRIKKNEILV